MKIHFTLQTRIEFILFPMVPTERLDHFLDPFRYVWWGIIVKKNDFVLPSSIIRLFFL